MHSRFVTLAFAAFISASAFAQDAKWEVEGHVGSLGVVEGRSIAGDPLPGPGPQFTTVNGGVSRIVPSWFFGDGARLLNDVQALAPTLPERIVPLDEAFRRPLAKRDGGVEIGLRISRTLSARFSAELSVDLGSVPRAITPETQASLNAARTSFSATWTSFFQAWKSTSPVRTFNVSTLLSTSPDDGSQLLTTGTLNISLRTKGRIIPYVAIGGGVVTNSGQDVIADLTGTYATPGTTDFLLNSDNVRLHSEVPRHLAVGVFGGGVRYLVTPRWGVRVDARVHLEQSKNDVFLDVNSGIGGGRCVPCVLSPGQPTAFGMDPSIQIVGNASAQQSLQGLIRNLRTVGSDGLDKQVIVSVGVFKRF